MRFTLKICRVKGEQKMLVRLSYGILTIVCKQPKICHIYYFSKNINFFLIFSKDISDIEMIIASSDRPCQILQMCLYAYLF